MSKLATNSITLTNEIALILTQSAHASLSMATSALLAQRIVQQCLPGYDQQVNAHSALVEVARGVIKKYAGTFAVPFEDAELLDAAQAAIALAEPIDQEGTK